MDNEIKPHPSNVAGPYYVEYSCCIACGNPHAIAPELFSFDEDAHCFIQRQPENEAEIFAMLQAANQAEVSCIRYRGNDPEILRRFSEMYDAHLCDNPPPEDISPAYRTHVSFRLIESQSIRPTAFDIAKALHTTLKESDPYDPRLQEYWHRFTEPVQAESSVRFLFSFRSVSNFLPIEFFESVDDSDQWLIRHSPTIRPSSRILSNMIHNWLVADGRFSDIRWYTEEEWNGSKNWQATPL